MFLYRLSFLVLLFHGSQALKECFDCVSLDDCPNAVDLAVNKKNQETAAKFKSALCGFDEKEDPKVCCSDFTQNAEVRIKDRNRIWDTTHPNIYLLPEQCGYINGERIVGGRNAGLYEFPWMALISFVTRDNKRFDCGGTLINERYVLTAAHCIKNKRIAGVRLGEYNTESKTDCLDGVCESFIQDLEVEEAIIHHNYVKEKYWQSDIGLLRLSEPADLSHKNVAPICLPVTPELQNFAVRGTTATVAGWGRTDSSYASPILQKVNIPVLTADKCKNLQNKGFNIEEVDTTNKLCAGVNNMDSCNGDSGGPLMIENSYRNSERIIQYGIVSYGDNECGYNKFGVYTEVAKYMKWILDNIKP